jgi:enamine deaminase RidA (YjgF/YER057c/UK114 family)
MFWHLMFVAGQTRRHPITGEVGGDVREQTRYAIERVKMILATAGTSLDNVLTVLTHLTKR